jgi:hypothetical protein
MSDLCKLLHEHLDCLPSVRFPFNLKGLPSNGIYFFYEQGEIWGHGDSKPRVVRVGTHKDGNFRSRIAEHFLLNEAKMNFDASKSPPHDRSIFRKNIGRVLLNKDNDSYLKIWGIDFTTKANRINFCGLRDIAKERQIEEKITEILRKRFSFRFILIDSQAHRIGSGGLESAVIGTLAHCIKCQPSSDWLGRQSPVQRIRESGLWLVQHLDNLPMSEENLHVFTEAVRKTQKWLANS